MFIRANYIRGNGRTTDVLTVTVNDFAGGPGGPTDAREGRTIADVVVAASAVRVPTLQEAEGDRSLSKSTRIHYSTTTKGDSTIAEQIGGEEHWYQRFAALRRPGQIGQSG